MTTKGPSKLKLNTKKPQTSQAPPSAASPPDRPLKITFKKASAAPTPTASSPPSSAAPADAPAKKEKRKYTKKAKGKPEAADDIEAATPATSKASKKRARKDEDDQDELSQAPPKRPTLKASSTSLKLKINPKPQPAPVQANIPPLKLSTKLPKIKIQSRPQSTTTPRIKVKHIGQPPRRDTGVGYDSEAEDIEIDPLIDANFILRMPVEEKPQGELPDPDAPKEYVRSADAELLRQAIADKKIGLPSREQGVDVAMRFYDKEGRRAMVSIQGRHYAASMVDLPCVIEGMKSWDKRGWWKSADICQMLFVHKRVQNEEEAKNAPLPKEVDQGTWQYPHGLTPPMHSVRKRRFRKRVSYRTIEAVEDEVERLLALDDDAKKGGGESSYEIVDLERLRAESSQPPTEDEDGYGVPHESIEVEGEIETDAGLFDESTFTQMLMADDEGDVPMSGISDMIVTADTPATENGILTANAQVVPAGGIQSATEESQEDDGDDGENDDDDADDDEEIDEDAMAEQQELAQQREEIEDLRKEIESAKQVMMKQTNPLLKQRQGTKVKSLESDLQLKLQSMGAGEDDF